jgi:hypothetical protein
MINGMLWALRIRAPWRDLPERDSPWGISPAAFSAGSARRYMIGCLRLFSAKLQVIARARSHGAYRAVIDCLVARRCAKAMGIRNIGTLGAVGRAKAGGPDRSSGALYQAPARDRIVRLRRVGAAAPEKGRSISRHPVGSGVLLLPRPESAVHEDSISAGSPEVFPSIDEWLLLAERCLRCSIAKTVRYGKLR